MRNFDVAPCPTRCSVGQWQWDDRCQYAYVVMAHRLHESCLGTVLGCLNRLQVQGPQCLRADHAHERDLQRLHGAAPDRLRSWSSPVQALGTVNGLGDVHHQGRRASLPRAERIRPERHLRRGDGRGDVLVPPGAIRWRLQAPTGLFSCDQHDATAAVQSHCGEPSLDDVRGGG